MGLANNTAATAACLGLVITRNSKAPPTWILNRTKHTGAIWAVANSDYPRGRTGGGGRVATQTRGKVDVAADIPVDRVRLESVEGRVSPLCHSQPGPQEARIDADVAAGLNDR
jgi:hypothetical protein